MLQIIYVSTANAALGPIDPAPILEVSCSLNLRDGITGLLYSDGGRFLQVLEGPGAETEAAMARIRCDRRHRAIVTLVQREIEVREFGEWSMAHYTPGSGAGAFLTRISALAATASPNLRATIEGFAEARRPSLQ